LIVFQDIDVKFLVVFPAAQDLELFKKNLLFSDGKIERSIGEDDLQNFSVV